MLPAFEKAYKKISKMTFADLLKNDLIDGVKSAKIHQKSPKKLIRKQSLKKAMPNWIRKKVM